MHSLNDKHPRIGGRSTSELRQELSAIEAEVAEQKASGPPVALFRRGEPTTEPKLEPELLKRTADQSQQRGLVPCPFDALDVYRVLLLFGVTDPCLQAALSALLSTTVQPQKDQAKSVQEAISMLKRWQDMRSEEANHSDSNSWHEPTIRP